MFKVGDLVESFGKMGVIIKINPNVASIMLEDLDIVLSSTMNLVALARPMAADCSHKFAFGDKVLIETNHNTANVVGYGGAGFVKIIFPHVDSSIRHVSEFRLRFVWKNRMADASTTNKTRLPDIDTDNSSKSQEDNEKARMMAFFARSAHER